MTVASSVLSHSWIPGAAMLAEALTGLVAIEADDIVVLDPDGAVQVLGTDYEITGNLRTGAASIRALVAYDPGVVLTATRVTDRSQDAAIPVGQPLPSKAVERNLDRRALIEQEIDATVTGFAARAVLFPVAEAGFTFPSPAARAGTVPAFNAITGAMQLLDYSGSVNLDFTDPEATILLGFVTAEQFGAVAYATKAEAQAGTNSQPAIDAARAYLDNLGGGELRFADGYYAIRTPLRAEVPGAGVNFDINADQSGVPFVLNKRQVWRSGPRKTYFVRRKNDGTSPATFAGTQQLANGQYWRGGMWLAKGVVDLVFDTGDDLTEAQHLAGASLTLRGNWDVDGGCADHTNVGIFDDTPIYLLDASGDGWDISDKAFWGENDRHFGDLVIDGHVHIHHFRGELVYWGRNGNILGRGTLELSETDADAFNPDPFGHIRFDGTIHIHDAYNGMEGGTGEEESWVTNLVIEDCNTAGSLRGDVFNAPLPSGYEIVTENWNGWTIGNLRVNRSPSFSVARYTHIDKALFVDCYPVIGFDNSANNGLAINSHIADLTTLADKGFVSYGVQFRSEDATPGTKGTRRNHVGRLTVGRTPYAVANGFEVQYPVQAGGYSLGEDNFVAEILGEASSPPSSANVDHAIGFGKIAVRWLVNGSIAHDLTASADLSYKTSPLLGLYEAGNPATGQKVAALVTVGPELRPPTGSVWTIINGGSRPVAIDTTDTRMLHRVIIPNGGRNFARFEFDGTFWTLIEKPPCLRNTAVYDPANLADGDGVTTTVALIGAVLGMDARATFTNDLESVALQAWVSAADVVSVRFQDETTAAVDLASGTITVSADYI